MNKPSLRTRVVNLTAKGLWVTSAVFLSASILLLYISEQTESVTHTLTGLFGFLGIVFTILIAFMAFALSLITKGSRKLDQALSQRPNTSRSGVVLDETDYQNK